MPTDPNTLMAMKQALLQSMNGGMMGGNFAQLTPEQQ
jgi:ribonucleotide reductase alpha subunit